ncbi:hypothetical protein GOM49_15375 [Clostridium bovifaecis]|uniref:Uncharacterized protein n=1 Tax=Clostridium bovifaecis TaxID=2184719 RepID=A0A6I6ERC3_9CLOT|nr:hypothetical protein GOM49_15375 [Clostridium bovifaecis]
MFVRRDVYETRIEDYLFVLNESRGGIEVFDKHNNMIRNINEVPENFREFKARANEIYKEIEKDL